LRDRATPTGPPQLVLLDGEPGVGKTTLACAAAQRAHDLGWTALLGSCSEHVNAPFEPFREILNHLVDITPMHVLAAHVTEHGGEVGRLTQRLSARVGALPPVDALDPETTRQLLIEAVADLLFRAADERPLLLILDSIHWADRSTLSVLGRLVRAHGHPLVAIGTNETRESGAADRSSLLAELRAMPNATTIEVQPFDEHQVLAVLERAAGHSLRDDGPALARHLVEETGGNPLFVAELARYFAQVGVIRIDERGAWHIDVPPSTVPTPPGVRAVIQQRLDRLGAGVDRILGAASVVGRSFESEVVAGILDLDEVTVLDALEEGVARSLLREVDVGVFEFTNPLVRQTVYDDLGATRRGLWHRAIAIALEARGDGVNPAVLAHHWGATGKDDRDKVVEWSHEAGLAALADLAPEDAAKWLRTALGATTSDDRRRLDILIDLGNAQRWAEADAFRQTLLDAAALAQRLGDDDALVRAALANNRGGASGAGHVDAERIAVVERALEVCGDADSQTRARLLATLAIELSQGPDLERRIAVSDEAVDIARRSGDELTLVRVLLLTLEANRVPATLERRMAETDELLALAVEIGDPVVIGIAAMRSLRVKFESGAFDQADGLIEILDEYARYDPYVLWTSTSVRAALANARGELDRALALADEALEISRSEADAAAVHLTTSAMVKRERGQLGDVIPALEYVLHNHPGVTGFRPLLGVAYAEVGRRDEAAALLQHEIDTELGDHPVNPLWMATVSMVALLAIDLESAPAARLLYPVLEPWRGRPCTSVVSYNGFVNEILGFLALVLDDLDRAEADFEAAIEQAARIGARVSHTRSRLGLARVRARRGDLAGAIELAGDVVAVAEEIGMTVIADRARQFGAHWAGETSPAR